MDSYPLKNDTSRPWIIRTKTSDFSQADSDRNEPRWRNPFAHVTVDINLIPNCTKVLPHNVCVVNTEINRTSHCEYDVGSDAWYFVCGIPSRFNQGSQKALVSIGVQVMTDESIVRMMGLPPNAVLGPDYFGVTDSLFLKDLDNNIICLVGRPL